MQVSYTDGAGTSETVYGTTSGTVAAQPPTIGTGSDVQATMLEDGGTHAYVIVTASCSPPTTRAGWATLFRGRTGANQFRRQ